MDIYIVAWPWNWKSDIISQIYVHMGIFFSCSKVQKREKHLHIVVGWKSICKPALTTFRFWWTFTGKCEFWVGYTNSEIVNLDCQSLRKEPSRFIQLSLCSSSVYRKQLETAFIAEKKSSLVEISAFFSDLKLHQISWFLLKIGTLICWKVSENMSIKVFYFAFYVLKNK